MFLASTKVKLDLNVKTKQKTKQTNQKKKKKKGPVRPSKNPSNCGIINYVGR